MNIETLIKKNVCEVLEALYGQKIEINQVQIKQIPKHLEGDYSVVTFPFAKQIGKAPNDIAIDMAKALLQKTNALANATAVNGFCNLSIGDAYWTNFTKEMLADTQYGQQPANGETAVVEYASPNTNKPLHLGHVRNNLLGYATAEILKKAGFKVKKVQIVNDRGVHICKSMLAWQKWGNGATPASTGMKGDHFVGHYYVEYEKHFQVEYKAWQKTKVAENELNKWLSDEGNVKKAEKIIEKEKQKEIEKFQEQVVDKILGKEIKILTQEELDEQFNLPKYFFKEVFKNQYSNLYSELGIATKNMLQAWEANDAEIRALWQKMNNWVYEGFDITYKNLGVNFDKLYYESDTYLVGKELVENELAKENSIFYKKEDGSTWVDLTDAKLDEKVVLRSDGTSMYITQDMGTATLRFQDFGMDRMVYVVANEQDYHFKVLFEILNRLGHKFAKNCYHLSYGMVNLPDGKMKSREGTVVDADDLLKDIIEDVQKTSEERDKLDGLSENDKNLIYKKVALGALKFYILKVESKKNMVFDPKESIELQGQTGPYILNAYVKTQSVQRMMLEKNIQTIDYTNYHLSEVEREILVLIHELPAIIQKAAQNYNPADLANYMYELAKEFHRFWSHTTILDPADMAATSFRLEMSKAVAKALRIAGELLGIEMIDRM